MTIPMKNGTAALAVRIKSEINIIVLNLIIWLRIFLFILILNRSIDKIDR